MTFNNEESAEDMADLVDYCFSAANDTEYGRLRAADGEHPQPYEPFWIEIGNEQGLTPSFVSQVEAISGAMLARARARGLTVPLRFAVGHNFALGDLDSPVALDMLRATRPLGANVVWDAHVGGDHVSNALDTWTLLTGMRELFRRAGSAMKLSVFEENGGACRMPLAHKAHKARSKRSLCGSRFFR